MLLIIYSKCIWMEDFIKYLRDKRIPHLTVTIDEFVNKISISDHVTHRHESSYWEIHGRKYYLKDISTIYHFIPGIEDKEFDQFVSHDKNYARSEYYAYLLYILSTFKRTLNAVSPILSVTPDRSLPAIYNYAQSNNIAIPKYCVSGNSNILNKFMDKHKVIASKDLFSYDDLSLRKRITPSDLMLCEKLPGAPTIVHLYGEKILATIMYREGKQIFDIPLELERKCILLAKKFQLEIAELYFIRTFDNDYVLYYISGLPNYEISAYPQAEIWANLSRILVT